MQSDTSSPTSQQSTLSCAVLIVDSYQTEPVRGFDVTFSTATRTQLDQVPIVRIFGVDSASGSKCCIHVHQSYPYLCVIFGETNEKRKNTFVDSLERALNAHAKVARHRVVEAVFFKGRNYYGYHQDEEVFLKISFSDPRTIKRASEVLTSGQVGSQSMSVFESHTPYALQFMIDHQIEGMNKINLAKYTVRNENGLEKQTCCELEVDCFVENITNQFEQQDMNPGLKAIWNDKRLSEVARADTTIVERRLVPSERERSYRNLLMKFLGMEEEPVKTEPSLNIVENSSPFQDTLLEAAEDILYGEQDSVLFGGPTDCETDEQEALEMSQMISDELLHQEVENPRSNSTIFSESNTQIGTQSFLEKLEEMRDDDFEDEVKNDDVTRSKEISENDEDRDSSDVFSDDTLVEESENETKDIKPIMKNSSDSEDLFDDELDDVKDFPLIAEDDIERDEVNDYIKKEEEMQRIKSEQISQLSAGCSKTTIHQPIVIESSSSEDKLFQKWNVLDDLPQKKRSAEVEEAIAWLRQRRNLTKPDNGNRQNNDTQPSHNDTLSQDLRFAYSFGGTPETVEEHYEMLTSMSCEIHCATRNNLKPDPQIDPIVAVIMVVHRDYPNEKNNYQIKVVYDGCVESKSLRRSLIAELGITKNVELIKCCGELEILARFGDILARCDPDILLGYEVDTLSWGYLTERCLVLELNPRKMLSRVAIDFVNDEPNFVKVELPPGIKFDSDKERYFESWEYKFVGRVLLNVWRIMRKEIALTCYSFENVYYHVLHKREPMVSFRTLREWFEDPLLASRCLAYYIKRCVGYFELIDKLEVYTKTCEMARIYGIQFYEVLSRGSQFRVESMMLRSTRRVGYVALSPTILDRNLQRSMEWIPLVMEPHSNFYTDPVLVLDFQSLYPSLMIAYNYCFSTCLGKVQDIVKGTSSIKFGCSNLTVDVNLLKTLKDNIIISPSGSIFVKEHIRRGILPQLVEQILNTRIMVKKGMKSSKSKSFNRILDARQLGLKLIANVTYGYTAASFSGRMPLVELADAIISKGKESLETAIKIVKETPKWAAEVIYGDTDSMFVLLRGRTKDEAFVIGKEMAEKISAIYPDPMKLKFEKVYLPCVLETKKRYFGYMYETEDQAEPVLDAKGIELIRRDGCKVQQVILEKAIRTLFETKSFDRVKRVVQKCFEQILKGRFGLHRFAFAKEYNGAKYYKENSCIPALKIARQLKSADPRAEPLVGERVPYIVTQGWDKSRIIDLIAHPNRLIEDARLRPNYTYYIVRVVCPALDRALLKVRTADWYHELPRSVRITPGKEVSKKTMVYEYFDSNRCLVCDLPGLSGNDYRLCETCRGKPQKSVFLTQAKLRHVEEEYRRIEQICRQCMTRNDFDDCISLDCPVLFRRIRLKNQFEAGEEINFVQFMF